jgi:phosphatidylserine/phosphatidylglycerophosphate/cardiolipin synthase-like enzyme
MPERHVAPLAAHARLLAPVFSYAAKGLLSAPISVKTLAASAGIPSARLPELSTALSVAASRGLLSDVGQSQWMCTVPVHEAERLSLLLRGVQIYLESAHQDEDTVSVVFSKPAEPSKLMEALKSSHEGAWDLVPTSEMLTDLAVRSVRRFTVMTPFVDDHGAQRILDLLRVTAPSVERRLIVRNGLPDALFSIAGALAELNTRVFDFRISKDAPGEHETFHAKVVMADNNECYVGSSNMTKWSFEYSLELGFNVRGKAARRVGSLVDAVISLSQEVRLA